MDELKDMYRKVSIYDLFNLIILVAVLSIINYKYVLPGVLGLVIAFGNFIISGINAKDAFIKKKVNFFTYFSGIIKVVLAGLAGCFLILYNKYYIMPYVTGYIFHFFSLIFYGQSIKNN